jgi:uncharacterized membrane-anchored protein
MLSGGDAAKSGLPVTDGRYWAAMLVAGTLGTAAGDALADDIGLGVGPASALLALVMGTAFGLPLRSAIGLPAFYWVAVVLIRTTGTTVGDLTAHTVGLVASTVVGGLLLAGTVALLRQTRTEPSPP